MHWSWCNMCKPIINIEDDSFQAILNCAVRYSLGRQTYMPDLVVQYIQPLIPYLDNRTLYVFKRDVEEAIDSEHIGDPEIDKPIWVDFLDHINSELSKR